MTTTEDGIELVYQVNHLAQFLMVRLLESTLTNARVVLVSSGGYLFFGRAMRLKQHYEFNSPLPKGHGNLDTYWSLGAYGDSKLFQVLTGMALEKHTKLKSAVAVGPGVVGTHFGDVLEGFPFPDKPTWWYTLVARSTQLGAVNILQQLTQPTSKVVYAPAYVPLPLSPEVTEENAQWCWEESNKIVAKFL